MQQHEMDQIAGQLSLMLARNAFCPPGGGGFPGFPYGGFTPYGGMGGWPGGTWGGGISCPPNPCNPWGNGGNGAPNVPATPPTGMMSPPQAMALAAGMGMVPTPGGYGKPTNCPPWGGGWGPWGGGACNPCGPWGGAWSRGDAVELARGEDSPFGLDTGDTDIPAGQTATVSTSPQKPCIPNRITVSDSVADNFACSAISVGVEPVMITVGNMSMAIFKSAATAPAFRAVPLVPGVDFSLTITNIATTDLRFIATVMAKAIPAYY